MVEMLFGRGLVKVSFVLFGLRGSRKIWCFDRTNMAVGVFLLAATHFLTTNVDGRCQTGLKTSLKSVEKTS